MLQKKEKQKNVLELSYKGVVKKEDLKTYLEISDDYKQLVSMKIIFFDIDLNAKTTEQLELRQMIIEKEKELKSRLINAIENFD